MFRRIVVAVAVLVLTGLAVTPASAQPAAQPPVAAGTSSCAAIRALLPIAGDGNYVLNTGSHLVPVYCHDMAGTPREYITLTPQLLAIHSRWRDTGHECPHHVHPGADRPGDPAGRHQRRHVRHQHRIGRAAGALRHRVHALRGGRVV
ncbi:GON domain-containing protein [Amycolatopsis sp. NPDC051373]|uniref:GON domain-containing protein n=1 Tax=Amycolatopsis sp. NPDC051373 TaxID=3155801 RepID=UPI00344EB60C